jgi:hypothetical protein
MRSIKVTFNDGNTVVTSVNGTDAEIRAYYIGQSFNLTLDESLSLADMPIGISVEFLDT